MDLMRVFLKLRVLFKSRSDGVVVKAISVFNLQTHIPTGTFGTLDVTRNDKKRNRNCGYRVHKVGIVCKMFPSFGNA